MAQTKRKRRSKHRGTPAGTIEARGRTGRKVDEKGRTVGSSAAGARRARPNRFDTPPTWKQSAIRAGIASGLLFAVLLLGLGPDTGVAQNLLLCLFAFAVYVPLGYFTDTALFRRRQRRKRLAAQSGKR